MDGILDWGGGMDSGVRRNDGLDWGMGVFYTDGRDGEDFGLGRWGSSELERLREPGGPLDAAAAVGAI